MTNEEIAVFRLGNFAIFKLKGGPSISGFAKSDPAHSELIRIDSMVIGNGGELEQLSLRLLPGEIESARKLNEPPIFEDSEGNTHIMPQNFWPDIE